MPENAAEAAPRRSARALRALPWAALVIAVLGFYWVEAAVRKSPWVFSDELEWSQLSRAIASTGHAARRTAPHSFESLYSFLIAPAWWIHSTPTAYAAIKYLNSVVMCLTAVPAYLLARLLVPRRTALVVALLSVAIPAMSYATSIVPESLAYLWFTASAYAAVRALAAPGVRSAIPAAVLAIGAPFVRPEFLAMPAALVLAAALLVILRAGTPALRVRRLALASGGLVLFAYLFNHFVVLRVQSWKTGEYFNHHTLTQGGLAAGALAVGLGMGPLIGGIASLYLPERAAEPAYRAYAVYLFSVAATCWVYTAAKSTYLLVHLQNLIEERNLFFLAPLLLLGSALVLGARRVNWWLVGVGVGVALLVVWSNRLEVGAPYYEAPGLAIPTLLNRSWVFTVQDVHAVLIAAAAIAVALFVLRRRRYVPAAAAVLAGAWLLTGEIYATKTNADFARKFATHLSPPRTWIDGYTQRAPTTFLGIRLNDADPVWLTEFWNRSIDHVYALDDSAPPPGPIAAPFLLAPDGRLADYTGDRYTVTSGGVELDAPVIARHPPDFILYSTPTPWRLRNELRNVYADGWGINPIQYSFFPRGGPGVLRIDLSRTAFNSPGPPARATIEIGTVKLTPNGDPTLGHVLITRHALVRNGELTTVYVHVASTPFAAAVVVTPAITTPGDTRELAAQPAFSFTRDR